MYKCAHTHTRRRLHSRVFCLLHSFAPNHHARACIALSWQILFGLWRYPAVVSPPFGNTNDFNVHSVCGARHSRRYYDIAAGWHSRPGFDVFSKTAQDPTNEKHHLLSQVLNGAFLWISFFNGEQTCKSKLSNIHVYVYFKKIYTCNVIIERVHQIISQKRTFWLWIPKHPQAPYIAEETAV